MKHSLPLLLAIVASVTLSGCAQVAVGLASAVIGGGIDRDRDKDAVRSHLRHGDTVDEARKAAFDDRFFQDMESLQLE